MLIMSLHQGIGSWATSGKQAWKDGSYCSALLYSIIARIISIAGLIFHVCYLPVHLVAGLQNARQAFSIHKMSSGAHGFLIAAKTALLALSIIIHGTLQTVAAIFIAEIAYCTIKTQKPLYSQHIITHIDAHLGIEDNLMTSIRQHINATGLQFDNNSFQAHFRTVWLRNSLANNTAKEFGDPDTQNSVQNSLEETISEYAIQQLQTLEQIDPQLYQEILQRLPQNPGNPSSQRIQAVVNQVRSHYSQESILFCKILFSHMRAASRDLVKRKCFEKDDIEMQMGGAYHAVVGLAILNMISNGTINYNGNPENLRLTGGSQNLTITSQTNIYNLRPSFIELRTLLTEMEHGRRGPEKRAYEACYKLLIARLSFPEKKEDNEKIEEQRKELEANHPPLAVLEANIFKMIGALTNVMNQRIITTNAAGLKWSDAFKA